MKYKGERVKRRDGQSGRERGSGKEQNGYIPCDEGRRFERISMTGENIVGGKYLTNCKTVIGLLMGVSLLLLFCLCVFLFADCPLPSLLWPLTGWVGCRTAGDHSSWPIRPPAVGSGSGRSLDTRPERGRVGVERAATHTAR